MDQYSNNIAIFIDNQNESGLICYGHVLQRLGILKNMQRRWGRNYQRLFARNPNLDEEGKVLDSEIEENGGVLPMFVIR